MITFIKMLLYIILHLINIYDKENGVWHNDDLDGRNNSHDSIFALQLQNLLWVTVNNKHQLV